MKRLREKIGVLILAFALSACAPAGNSAPLPTPQAPPSEEYLTPGDYVETIAVDRVDRQFTIHIPPGYRLDTPLPLVIDLHGRGGTALQQARVSRFQAKADREGFVVASPQALGQPATWWPAPGPQGEADLDFFRAMIAYIETQINVDPARIYVAGFSNGGAMANRLACTLSDKIAAIASVAGAHPQMESCDPFFPVSVITFHGLRDDVVPYMGDGGYLPPVPAWMAAWARRNGCNAAPSAEPLPEGATIETWQQCLGDTELALVTLPGGGHAWPGSGPGLSPGMDATDFIWTFFETHPKRLADPAQAAPPAPLPSAIPTEEQGSLYSEPGDYVGRVYSRSEPRLFKLHVPPSYRPGESTPLVIVLHGIGQEVAYLEAMSEMSHKADEAGFLVVYPQASLLQWDVAAQKDGGADVVFIQILLVYLQRHLSIDPARIYATGFSNGASMAHRLGCDLADVIAAIAPVSGSYPRGQDCEPGRPIPVVAFHGTGDTHVGYQSEEHDVPRWAADWAARNGCDPTPVPGLHQGDVRAETWGNCKAGATVRLYTIEGGRHIWPGSAKAREFFPEVQDVSANDVIWDFFQAHPRPTD